MNKYTLTFAALMSVLTGFCVTKASEIDPFRLREELSRLEDMNTTINAKSNSYIKQAISRANKKGNCNESRLYKELRKYFRNHLVGKLAPYIIESDDIERIETSTTQSIYRDFKWYEAVIPGLYAKLFIDPAGKILNLDGHLIGTDKFEHFMGTGYQYFKIYNQNTPEVALEKILKKGWGLETGLMGIVTTGVLSYADMVANFNGMRFWNHMLQNNDDILGENLGPYIICKDKHWVANIPLDWSRYVDPAWDEAINCSKFRTESMLSKVEAVVANYQRSTSIRLTCPISPLDLEQTVESKYRALAPWTHSYLFNSNGFGVVEKAPNQ